MNRDASAGGASEVKVSVERLTRELRQLDGEVSALRREVASAPIASAKHAQLAKRLQGLLDKRIAIKAHVAAASQPSGKPPSFGERQNSVERDLAEESVDHLHWTFVQSFGDDNSSEDDLVTAVQFDKTGRFLAVGDKAGRICVFELQEPQTRSTRSSGLLEYQYFSEFQSHEPEFDVLKSLEIEEKINRIEWPAHQCSGFQLLATNDKTIKLWKIANKTVFAAPPESSVRGGALYMPDVEEQVTSHTERRVYANAHQYHVNSVSANSDGETFLSSDDLRVNLWHYEISAESFNVVDVKPQNLEDLTEVITSACFHPFHCHTFLYSSSRGSILLNDMRDAALCDHQAKQYKIEEDATTKSFFSEIISSISDAKFTADGRYMVARDYLTIKVWDVNMEREPVTVIPVHDYLRTQLCELYENDCLFDKFECDASDDGHHVVTGSYTNNFTLCNVKNGSTVTVEAEKDAPRRRRDGGRGGDHKHSAKDRAADISNVDFQKKMLHVAWHPTEYAVAIAGLNKIYIYQAVEHRL